MVESNDQLNDSELQTFSELILNVAYENLFIPTIIDEGDLIVFSLAQITRLQLDGTCQLEFTLKHIRANVLANGTCIVKKGETGITDFKIDSSFKALESLGQIVNR